jgi:molybdopterin converting factor small subunit
LGRFEASQRYKFSFTNVFKFISLFLLPNEILLSISHLVKYDYKSVSKQRHLNIHIHCDTINEFVFRESLEDDFVVSLNMDCESSEPFEQVSVRLYCFAAAKDRTGVAQTRLKLKVEWTDQDSLLTELVARYPTLADIRPVLALAINEEYVMDQTTIHLTENDVIALIPPISGG